MKHTPEPWAFDEESADVRFDGRGSAIEGNRLGCVIARPQQRTDGRRIVACVNACAGIADPADLRKQRDELLAVAKRLVGIIKAHDLESLSCDRDGHGFCECLGDAVTAATAAIANAEQTTGVVIQWGPSTGGSGIAKYGRQLEPKEPPMPFNPRSKP